MKCGHLADSINKKEVKCSRCNCQEIELTIKTVWDYLEGRKARCGDREVKSRWDLPGFVYRPEEKYDKYFYGNRNATIQKELVGHKEITRYTIHEEVDKNEQCR